MDHSNHILRHAHHLRKRVAMPEPQGGTKTVVEVVFVTSPPTFDGEPAGFVTADPQDGPTLVEVVTALPTSTSSPSRSKQQSVAAQEEESEKEELKTTMRTSTRSQASVASSAASSESSVVKASTIATTTPSHTTAFGGAATLGSATSAALPTATEAPTNSAGLTIGAYAGIVGGGVALIMLVVVIVAVMVKKRNNKSYEKPEDEKNMKHLSFSDRSTPSPVSPVPTPKPAMALAPKLEIRPMTQFDGSFFPSGNTDTMRSQQEKPIRAPPPALSLDSKNLTPGPFETPEPSPAMSAFSDSSNITLPIQGATGGPNSSSPVHRVMVDFKPSMADELELRSGEVVRMLHEYDDGWALCIRLDRTQQGVCPRTCLSPKPVKPRPPPPGIRGPGGPPHPYSPSAGRPQSPSFGPGSRPQSPRSPGPNRPPMSPKGMPGPPRRPMGSDSRPESPMGARPPHPLSRVQRDDDVQFHAM
ncbi:hypothetical protein TWF481_008662 [Arthrobotrys musiformis]|uniref:SH3 domain-containing protein n=1 Tax=Arthrobotrys musiformis TaxID=47236 RepID=A0AAV9W7V5_9PEZI